MNWRTVRDVALYTIALLALLVAALLYVASLQEDDTRALEVRLKQVESEEDAK